MADEKPAEASLVATQVSEPIQGEDLKLIMRMFGLRNPQPLLEAVKDDPQLAQFLPGAPPDDLDEVAKAVDEAVERLTQPPKESDAER